MTDRIADAEKAGAKLEEDLAGRFEDGKSQLKDKFNQAAGAARDAYGQVRGQAQGAYNQARDRTMDTVDDLEGYVREQPLAALAIGAGVGLLIGLLVAGSAKTIYLRR